MPQRLFANSIQKNTSDLNFKYKLKLYRLIPSDKYCKQKGQPP